MIDTLDFSLVNPGISITVKSLISVPDHFGADATFTPFEAETTFTLTMLDPCLFNEMDDLVLDPVSFNVEQPDTVIQLPDV